MAGFDEDAITLGVAAAHGLQQVADDAAVYFATATPPFADKTNATVVRAALGWGEWRLAVDLAGLRSGFGALSLAASTGGIAIMGDVRVGRAGSTDEAEGGAGGAAFVFGHESPHSVAEVLASTSSSAELMDVWRVPGADHAQTSEDRFVQHVLSREVEAVVTEVVKRGGVSETPTVTLVAAPQRRFAVAQAKAIGFSGETNVLARHRASIGYCGAADVGVQLSQALDVSRAGDTILLVNAVGSVDAMLLRVLRDGRHADVGTTELEARRPVSYADFLIWSGRLEREPARRPEKPAVAGPPAARNASWKYSLTGGRCKNCGKVYLPAHRVCGGCGSIDSHEPHPVSRRRGRVAAFSTDAVSDSPAAPAIAAMVDFDGGGRLLMEIADAGPDEIALDDVVEPVFRRVYEVRGVPNYFWKARRVQGADA